MLYIMGQPWDWKSAPILSELLMLNNVGSPPMSLISSSGGHPQSCIWINISIPLSSIFDSGSSEDGCFLSHRAISSPK